MANNSEEDQGSQRAVVPVMMMVMNFTIIYGKFDNKTLILLAL
jgi:hypothetical protein